MNRSYQRLFRNKFQNSILVWFRCSSNVIADQLSVGRPRRSLLYVPGSSEKKLQKIPELKADCAVMDCEDGVAISQKANARETIRRMLDELEFVKTERSVRVNAIESEFIEEDLKYAFGAEKLPESIVFPKIERVEHIDWIHDRLTKLKRNSTRINLIALIESARAFLNLDAICRRAEEKLSRTSFPLDALIFGSDDFCATIGRHILAAPFYNHMINDFMILCGPENKLQLLWHFIENSDIHIQESVATASFVIVQLLAKQNKPFSDGATRTKTALEVLFARQYFVLVAKAYHLQAIDMVYIDFKDIEGFRSQCVEGAQMGFTGKQIIHPGQIPVAQVAFSPSEDKILRATQLIRAFEDHQKSGKGAFTFDGSMIDMPTVLQARNVLKMAESFSRS